MPTMSSLETGKRKILLSEGKSLGIAVAICGFFLVVGLGVGFSFGYSSAEDKARTERLAELEVYPSLNFCQRVEWWDREAGCGMLLRNWK